MLSITFRPPFDTGRAPQERFGSEEEGKKLGWRLIFSLGRSREFLTQLRDNQA